MIKRSITRRAFLSGLAGTAAAATIGWNQRRTIWKVAYSSLQQLSAPPLVVRDVSALQQAGPFDICIIGSGPAGAVLARDLVAAGLRTVILESGFAPDQERDSRLGQLDVYDPVGDIQYPLAGSRVRAIGGTSAIWTGRCARLHPLDFDVNAYTPPDNPWPISYDMLEPYYERAEETLRVEGPPPSSYHAPRRDNLPLPGDTDLAPLQALLEPADILTESSPTSVSLRQLRGPMRIATDILPDVTESNRAMLIPGVTVTALIDDSSGRIQSVQVRTLSGQESHVQANTYIIACGAVESARLLLLSRTSNHPQGIGNHSDQLGRYFMEHPNLFFRGALTGASHPVSNYIGRSHQFYEEFKQRGFGSIILVFYWNPRNPELLRIAATVEMSPERENRISLSPNRRDYFDNPAARLQLVFSDKDKETFTALRQLVGEIYAKLGINDVTEDQTVNWSHHHMGTCRMGQHPATSVVDPDLRVHETENLYVLGSSVFVTAGASHPTLAITALAHRLADHLISRHVQATTSATAPALVVANGI